MGPRAINQSALSASIMLAKEWLESFTHPSLMHQSTVPEQPIKKRLQQESTIFAHDIHQVRVCLKEHLSSVVIISSVCPDGQKILDDECRYRKLSVPGRQRIKYEISCLRMPRGPVSSGLNISWPSDLFATLWNGLTTSCVPADVTTTCAPVGATKIVFALVWHNLCSF